MRIIIDVDITQEAEYIKLLVSKKVPSARITFETAGQQILRTIREHKYHPDKDPMIKRFNDRINRL